MKLSRTIAYALHATLELAHTEPNRPIPCSELARRGNMPERFLLQILRTLVTHGILESTRGVEGGYCLSRPPKEISVLDVIDAFDNPLTPSVPDLKGVPPHLRARLIEALQQTADAARKELRRLTIADLE